MNTGNKKILFFAIAALVVLCLAYSNHFNNGFHFDDSHTVEENVFIRNTKYIPDYFTNPKMFSADPDHWGLRPVVTTTLAIDYKLGGGLKPFYFHLSTFLWHIALCILLFFVFRNLLRRTIQEDRASWMSAIMAAWFGLHTANAETINYVISRSDVLSTFFITASFYIYINWPQKRKYYLYLIPAVIGVFAKETVPMLVIILFFYILFFEKGLSVADVFKKGGGKAFWNTVVKVLPLAIVVALVQLYTLSKVTAIPGISNPMLYYVLTQSYVWVRYFLAFLVPGNLSADSDWTVITNPFDERILIGLVFVTALIVIIIRTSAKAETRPIAFGLVWFCAALLPTSLAPFAEVTNDHRMYFAFVGLVLSVVSYANILLQRAPATNIFKSWKMALPLLVALVLGLNAYGVYQRNKIWKTEESLWYDVTVKSPGNGRGLMNYGLTQMAKGNYPVAQQYYEKALLSLPYYPTLYINLGILKNAQGQPQAAEPDFQKAINLSNGSAESYFYYAQFLARNRRFADAKTIGEKALSVNPNNVHTLEVLMDVYYNLGMSAELTKTANQLLALVPDHVAAKKYLEIAKGKAMPVAPQQPQTAPATANDYLNLSLQQYNEGKYEECIETCKKALQLKPDFAEAYNNIGAAYNQLKQWDKSIPALKKALEISPANKFAANNLKWAEEQNKAAITK
ncbi:MAG: tetratricopeptide repeat protein [Filimonas sp.]|nr:tetratricopeptide repeat protein [Filimonas sp.]